MIILDLLLLDNLFAINDVDTLSQDGKKDYSTLKYIKHQIFQRSYMLQQEGKNKGYPLRTFSGGMWMNGFSDHLPTIVYLIKQQ